MSALRVCSMSLGSRAVVICTLSPLCMLLLHAALSLLGCVWPHTTLLRPRPPQVLSSQGIMILASAMNPLSPIMSPEGARPTPRPSIHASPCGHCAWTLAETEIAMHTVPLFCWAALGLMTFLVPTANIRSCHRLSKVLIRSLPCQRDHRHSL